MIICQSSWLLPSTDDNVGTERGSSLAPVVVVHGWIGSSSMIVHCCWRQLAHIIVRMVRPCCPHVVFYERLHGRHQGIRPRARIENANGPRRSPGGGFNHGPKGFGQAIVRIDFGNLLNVPRPLPQFNGGRQGHAIGFQNDFHALSIGMVGNFKVVNVPSVNRARFDATLAPAMGRDIRRELGIVNYHAVS